MRFHFWGLSYLIGKSNAYLQYDGSLLNGLQTVPRWQQDFDRPAGQILGLIGASFYLRKSQASMSARETGPDDIS
jgi:hypothetical protein